MLQNLAICLFPAPCVSNCFPRMSRPKIRLLPTATETLHFSHLNFGTCANIPAKPARPIPRRLAPTTTCAFNNPSCLPLPVALFRCTYAPYSLATKSTTAAALRARRLPFFLRGRDCFVHLRQWLNRRRSSVCVCCAARHPIRRTHTLRRRLKNKNLANEQTSWHNVSGSLLAQLLDVG